VRIVVSKEKLILYLLKPRNRNDKSKFLNKLGFYESNWELLQKAIIEIYQQNLPESYEENQFGIVYNISGMLKGLNGNSKYVKTIWVNLFSSDTLNFITLFPGRNKK